MIVRRCVACLIMALVSACALERPKLDGNIAIAAKRIPANLNQQAGASKPALSVFAQTVVDARNRNLTRNPATCQGLIARDISHDAGVPINHGQAMVLSGGGPHGTFGAGLFLGLADKDLLPPEPEVVTGVSTGSLQATFVFLARQPVAKDRDYTWLDPAALPLHALPGADHRPPLVAAQSNLGDLALAYSIVREGEILKPGALGALGVVTSGALGELTPLRRRLLRMISPDTITQIATEACRGRVLMVGVADVDDGYGYALDLTALALDAFDGHASATRMDLVRNTYVSALLASSSVPAGAMPVTLRYREFKDDDLPAEIASRQHLFIDGGARFGVFLPRDDDQADVTLIVNTSLDTAPWTAGNPARPRGTWSILTLGQRTVSDLLEAQVYQLSVGQVETAARTLAMAELSNSNITMADGTPGENPDAHVYLGKTCIQWHDDVDKPHHPIQFYPDYMACLIDYGRMRGNLGQWNLVKR